MKKILLLLLFIPFLVNSQTLIKISNLPSATTIQNTDLFILNQGTTTKKITYSVLNNELKDTFVSKNELQDYETDPVWTAAAPYYITHQGIIDSTFHRLKIDTIQGVQVYIAGDLIVPTNLFINAFHTSGFGFDPGENTMYLIDPILNSGNPFYFINFLRAADTTINAGSRKIATKYELSQIEGGSSDSIFNKIKIGTTNDTTVIDNIGIRQYTNGSEVFSTDADGAITITGSALVYSNHTAFGFSAIDNGISVEVQPEKIELNSASGDTFKVTEQSNIYTTGNIDYAAGASHTRVRVPGILKDFLADSTTSGTGETDLYNYTLPANVLATNGDKLIFNVFFDLQSSPTNAYIRFYFAGDSVVWVDNATSPVGYVTATFTVMRISSSECRVYVEGTDAGFSNDQFDLFTSWEWTISNIIKVTGQCSTNAITAKYGYIEYKPAAP